MRKKEFVDRGYIVKTYINRQLELVKGEGVFLLDKDGKKYLDLMSNYGASIFGYAHPELRSAIEDQLGKLSVLHGSFSNPVRNLASKQLLERAGEDYREVFWSNSGSEAIEAALKFAVLTTGKKKFITCINGFHGKTLGALSATYGEKYRQAFEPLLWDFVQIPYGDSKALLKAIDEDTGAFLLEPIQGDGGINVPKEGYLKEVREICSRKGVLLIVDEIQTGAGRTGSFLRIHHEEINADILTLGKGLAGGLPVGATLVNLAVSQAITRASHTSTFGGNPLVSAGVLASLGILSPGFLADIKSKGEYFKTKLQNIKSGLIKDVRGEGLMLGISIKDKRNEVLKNLQQAGVLAIPSGDDIVRFLPPFIIQKENIDHAVEVLAKVLKKLDT